MTIIGRVPRSVGDDEHILKRLGWAVTYQWNALPKDVRDLLLSQATFVEVPPTTVQLKQQIEAFVRKHADAD